jgi:NitT/TauT family transport system substrate-binding protein
VSRPESAGHDTAALHRVAGGNLQSAGPALVGVKEGFFAKSLGGTKLSAQAFNAGPFGGNPANQERQEGLCSGS